MKHHNHISQQIVFTKKSCKVSIFHFIFDLIPINSTLEKESYKNRKLKNIFAQKQKTFQQRISQKQLATFTRKN